MRSVNVTGVLENYFYDANGLRLFVQGEGKKTLYFYDGDAMPLCEWVYDSVSKKSNWDKLYLHAEGKTAVSFDNLAAQPTQTSLSKHRLASLPTLEVTTPALITQPSLSWSLPEPRSRVEVELRNQADVFVWSLKGTLRTQARLNKLTAGSYKQRVRIENGVWSAWKSFSYQPVGLPAPLSSYKLDGNGADSGSNPLTPYGTSWLKHGSGSSASFNGSALLLRKSAVAMPLASSARSFSLWIQPNLRNALPGASALLLQGHRHNIGLLINEKGLLGVKAGIQKRWGQPTRSSVNNDAWTHVVLTYEAGSARLYLNGTLVETFASLGINTLSGDLALGNYSGSELGGIDVPLFYGFQGGIDQAEVYGQRLSDSQVMALYLKQHATWN